MEYYTNASNHLLGVSPAEVVARKGVDLVKLNATLLKQIEELTLYSIQQEKARQQQQAEIDELKQLVKQLVTKK